MAKRINSIYQPLGESARPPSAGIAWRFALLFALAAAVASAQASATIDLSKLVVVGDSLSAGFQNYSLLDTQQVNSYAALLARQAGVSLVLPTIPYPGVPNVLQLVSLGPPVVVAPVSGMLPPIPRDNPLQQATNLAVPGMVVADVLDKRPGPNVQTAIDAMTNIILGFPTPLIVPGPSRSQLEEAVALTPSAVLIWIGANDVLWSVLTGDPSQLTPLPSFTSSYFTMMATLSRTNARLIVANIPDVTIAPYLTPVKRLAEQSGLSIGITAHMLGISPGDFVRPGALPLAFEILAGKAPGPLPQTCPASIPGIPLTQAPCVFTAQQAISIRADVDAFNLAIASAAALYHATVVDTHSLFEHLRVRGYVANGLQFTADFLGGLFTLDGLHPTNTLHAILANEFIDVINSQFGTNIPEVSVNQVAASDPLVIPALLEHAPGNSVSK